ncbi:MAG: type VI secretion system ATPase TssH, partial [Lachnospiraceae bacterium]|nr:type VI secretion system ATPase TssH [Lachnospiraceae bacterium]
MNIQKFTQKSIEAINNCQQLAYEYGNQQMDQEHLLYSLLTIDDSLILKLIEKMGIDGKGFTLVAQDALNALPKVSGSNAQLYFSSDLNKALLDSEKQAKTLGDEYVSVEHIFLSLLQYPNRVLKRLFKEYAIDRERFLQVLSSVRGNQKVTSDNPE